METLAERRNRFKESTIFRSFSVLNRVDRTKIWVITAIQISLNLLDLLGVAMVGLLGALSVTGIQSANPSGKLLTALQILHIQSHPFQQQVAIIGIIAAVTLVLRTFLSVYFSRKILYYLSSRCAEISAKLTSYLLAQSLIKIQRQSPQENLFALTSGVTAIVMGIISTTVIMASDFALLIILSIGLLFIDVAMSLGTILLFTSVGFVLFKLLHVRASELGRLDAALNIETNDKVLEVLSSYREAVVGNRRPYYTSIIGTLRRRSVQTQAELTFMPSISKYILESVVVFGALGLSAFQFLTKDAQAAVSTLTVFMAAGTRIAPALLRIQQGAIHIKQNIWSAETALKLIPQHLGEKSESIPNALDVVHSGFQGTISLSNVSFTYPESKKFAIRNLKLEIPKGCVAAFVGPSGAGKTTLADILLGVIEPDTGEVAISGLNPTEAIARWPGAIAYVPQDVYIAKGDIRTNVALGYPFEVVSDAEIMKTLEVADLEKFVQELPNGIYSDISERGSNLSGGQRQRLGIARALFTRPNLLVLDEATSALDGESENRISTAIHALKGSTTVILIAHRLSTIKEADIVYYMDGGVIRAQGSFEHVRRSIPEFDELVKVSMNLKFN